MHVLLASPEGPGTLSVTISVLVSLKASHTQSFPWVSLGSLGGVGVHTLSLLGLRRRPLTGPLPLFDRMGQGQTP